MRKLNKNLIKLLTLIAIYDTIKRGYFVSRTSTKEVVHMMSKQQIDQVVQNLSNELRLSGDFFVERLFISAYAKQVKATDVRIGRHDISENPSNDNNSGYSFNPQTRLTISVPVFFVTESIANPEYLRFTYWDFADNRGLLITDPEDNVLYKRSSNQDHRTQWHVNVLADKALDDNGQFIFREDPSI